MRHDGPHPFNVAHSHCYQLLGQSGKDYMDRIWAHSVRNQQLFTSKSGFDSGPYYVSSGVWGQCPQDGNQWEIARVGVMAHELCHNLGVSTRMHLNLRTLLPILTYQILYIASRSPKCWLLRASWYMWGRSNNQKPPMMGAWSRYHIGFVKARRITSSGTYQLNPFCETNTVYRIDHNMPDGEYFLIENRHYDCYYDDELEDYAANGSMNRNGAAIWHVDETDLLGLDAYGKEVIGYYTDAYPGNNKYPARHFEVALVQGDGEWDIEKRTNMGDKRDLFKQAPAATHPDTGHKIGSSGVVLNNGVQKPSPSTRSYAYGRLAIEFGPGDHTMTMTVTLEGDPVPEPSPEPSPAPTTRPTPKPSSAPTQRPTPDPSPAPTPQPTREPSPAPTSQPTPHPSLAPTPQPIPEQATRPSTTNSPTTRLPPTTRPPITLPPPTQPPTTRAPTNAIAAVTTSDNSMKITRLVLVDAVANEDIPGGLSCLPYACTGGSKLLDIRAEYEGGLKSVKFSITGPSIQENRVEKYV